MRAPDCYHLILASNFEYGQDLDKVDIGPATFNYTEKEILARRFMTFLQLNNPGLHGKIRMVQGEPPLGQGHARIISIGISVPHADFELLSRYLRTFLDQSKEQQPGDLLERVPVGEFRELYQLDPFFAPFPHFEVSLERVGTEATGDCLITFGRCSFGEFDGVVYGKEEYERLMAEVTCFQDHLAAIGKSSYVRPWHFEVDPYRRHSVIAAAGMRFDRGRIAEALHDLKAYLSQKGVCKT
jgi:hypothetical protein